MGPRSLTGPLKIFTFLFLSVFALGRGGRKCGEVSLKISSSCDPASPLFEDSGAGEEGKRQREHETDRFPIFTSSQGYSQGFVTEVQGQ